MMDPALARKILICCPLGVELQCARQALEKSGYHFVQQPRKLIVPALSLEVLQTGQGKVETALSVQQSVLQSKTPELAILIGFGGALSESLTTHDVVIPECVVEHDYKSLSLKHKQIEFQYDSPDRHAFFNFLNQDRAELSQGRIASGDEDIFSIERRQELGSQYQCSSVAWEGAGFARASRRFGYPHFEVRLISDDFKRSIFNHHEIAPLKDSLSELFQNLFLYLTQRQGTTP